MDWNIVAAVNSVFSICEQILRITRDEITEAQSIAKDSEYFKRFEGEMDFLKYQAQKLPNDWQHELWKQIYNIVPTDKTQCTIMLSACIAHCPIHRVF